MEIYWRHLSGLDFWDRGHICDQEIAGFTRTLKKTYLKLKKLLLGNNDENIKSKVKLSLKIDISLRSSSLMIYNKL